MLYYRESKIIVYINISIGTKQSVLLNIVILANFHSSLSPPPVLPSFVQTPALSAFCLFLLLPQALLSAASFSPYLRSFPPVIRTRPVGGVFAWPLRSSRPAVVRVVCSYKHNSLCLSRSFFS